MKEIKKVICANLNAWLSDQEVREALHYYDDVLTITDRQGHVSGPDISSLLADPLKLLSRKFVLDKDGVIFRRVSIEQIVGEYFVIGFVNENEDPVGYYDFEGGWA